MSLGTDLLNLRRNKTSSVATLIGGMERLAAAQSAIVSMSREWALADLADRVVTNVAVYAQQAYWGDAPLPKQRRASFASRWRQQRVDLGQLYQRRLFA
jgi:hypothetical protein